MGGKIWPKRSGGADGSQAEGGGCTLVAGKSDTGSDVKGKLTSDILVTLD